MATNKRPAPTPEEKKRKTLVLSGIAFWASVQAPNKRNNKFILDLSIDSKTAKLLEDAGIDVKQEKDTGKGKKRGQYVGVEGKDRGTFVTIKSEFKPVLVDAKKKELDSKTLIGNGSKVKVATHLFKWHFEGDTGLSLGLDAVQVLELVAYANDPTALFDEEDGFETESATDSFDDESEDDDDSDEEVEAPKKSKTPKVSKSNPF